MWYTVCVCYSGGLGDEGAVESVGLRERELMGGPLDGLVVEFSSEQIIWTIPGMFPGMDGNPLSHNSDWGTHVYALRKTEPDRMYYVGVMSPNSE